MPTYSVLPLALGLIIFSFLVNSMLVVPFINALYKLRMLRKKEGVGAKKESLFDKYHDKKAGTPTGGGVLLILSTVILFFLIFPIAARLGVFIHSAYGLRNELFIVFFSFISFGILGLSDDLMKIFGKATPGPMGMWIGMGRKLKFGIQCLLATFIGLWLYKGLGISILHIPFFDIVLNLGAWYVPFAALIIIFFTNAFNFTDGLDGLASGVLMIFLFAYVIIAVGSLDTPLFIFISLWLGSVIAFLYFNVWPARVILGDAGALSFGATIAVIGLLMGNVVALFIIGGIFVIEAASSAIQILGWKILKRRIFPLAPIHHSFLTIGWEEPKIVMRAWLAAIVLAIFGLWLATI
jgi:phospho-N-acetylmuramoyl-pentapeptide-transferase